MRHSFKTLLKAASARLGWPRILDGTGRHDGAGANRYFRVAIRGQLKITIKHDGGELEQCFPVDAREPLLLTVHSLAEPKAAQAAKSQPVLKLTLSNLWTLLALRVRRVLLLHRLPSIGVVPQRVYLPPLPPGMASSLPPDPRLGRLARSSTMDAVNLEVTSVGLLRIAPKSFQFQGADLAGLADMLTRTAQLDQRMPLAPLYGAQCSFDGILNSPCPWDSVPPLDKARP